MFKKVLQSIEKVHYVKFEKDELLLESLTKYAKDNNIKTAEISFIGAVQNVNVMYFNQSKKEYDKHTFDGGHEVLNGLGNISLLNGKPFVHVHMTVADKNGNAFGGHLDEGTKIWLIEAVIRQPSFFLGKGIERHFDDELCLSVWKD